MDWQARMFPIGQVGFMEEMERESELGGRVILLLMMLANKCTYTALKEYKLWTNSKAEKPI